MESTGKYRIVTGITAEYKVNPQNPKYFAKFINDDLMAYGHTEAEAIEHLKRTFDEYTKKNQLHSPLSNKVLNTDTSKEKFDKYYRLGISSAFFELIGEDENIQLDDETTIKDLELSSEQIEIINKNYKLAIAQEDIVVNVFE